MSKKTVVQGDATDHGGTVIQVSGSLMVNGKRAARKGDIVSCPIHGDNQITECSGFSINGMSLALNGDKSACGSVLQASAPLFYSN